MANYKPTEMMTIAAARLLKDPAEARAIGTRAAAVVSGKSGALHATVQQLLPLLG